MYVYSTLGTNKHKLKNLSKYWILNITQINIKISIWFFQIWCRCTTNFFKESYRCKNMHDNLRHHMQKHPATPAISALHRWEIETQALRHTLRYAQQLCPEHLCAARPWSWPMLIGLLRAASRDWDQRSSAYVCTSYTGVQQWWSYGSEGCTNMILSYREKLPQFVLKDKPTVQAIINAFFQMIFEKISQFYR